jgi:lysine 2,3-aminomutase
MKTPTSIKTVDALHDAGLCSSDDALALSAVTSRYALAITPEITSLIDKTDEHDPIARQFVPSLEELTVRPQELADPIGDAAHSPVPGIVHRYPDRVLLKAIHICPVYCRFCFRREMVGPDGHGTMSSSEIDAALSYIREHSEIWEVILTGGDPLIMSPRRLTFLMQALGQIDHVKIIRLHSRVPVVSPSSITPELIDALKVEGKAVYVALHANHANEFSQDARRACASLVDAGIVMVSQTVLLKGINDNLQSMSQLMRCFVENRIKPYYLHHPDLAPGTSHFRVSIAAGQKLMRELRGNISGLCQPTYVLDIPGGYGKAPLTESAISTSSQGTAAVEDFKGEKHYYVDHLCGFTPQKSAS